MDIFDRNRTGISGDRNNPPHIDPSKTVPLNEETYNKTIVSRLLDRIQALTNNNPEAYIIREQLDRALRLGTPTQPLQPLKDSVVSILSDKAEEGTEQQPDDLDDYYPNHYGIEESPNYNLTSLLKVLGDILDNFLTDTPDSTLIINNLYELENYIDKVDNYEERKYCEWAVNKLEEFFMSEENISKENFDKQKERMYQILIKLQDILRKNFGY